MAGKQAIKNRIRSVESTMKITKAMQLVAASKLRKCKDRMENNREYAYYLKETFDAILTNLGQSNHPYLQADDSKPTLTIVFTSDMGLCGGYNANILRLMESSLNKDEPLITFGSRADAWVRKNHVPVVKAFYNVNEEDFDVLSQAATLALEKFSNHEIGKIQILYTRYVNPLTFEPTLTTLLPVEAKASSTSSAVMEFEPEGDQILDSLVPQYLRSMAYSYWLETKTSEQGSRQNAMDTASDNAEELVETLTLQYNQARQAAITQEITEIVAGANAAS